MLKADVRVGQTVKVNQGAFKNDIFKVESLPMEFDGIWCVGLKKDEHSSEVWLQVGYLDLVTS